jgi:general stress protein 26
VLTDLTSIRRACVEVMQVSEAVYVTTLDEEGGPVTRAMFNLRRKEQFPSVVHVFDGHDEDLLVLLSTNTSSAKVRHVTRDPRVSLYYCIPHTFHGVMLGGRVSFESDLALKHAVWQEGWETYFPTGVEDPDFTLLSLRPTRARGWLRERAFDARLDDV